MSNNLDTGPRKFVVFLDSLGQNDVEENTDFIQQHAYDGTMDAGNPYVTPKVLGEIYTGKSPGEHGLPSVSRYGQDPRYRPAAPTLPEIAAEDDTHENVCNFGLPFIAPAKADPTGNYWHSSSAMQQQFFTPDGAQNHLFVPGPAGDLSDPDEDGGLLFNHRVDYVRSTFATARSVADTQDFDVMFISCRILDSYCHYRFTEPEDEPATDRDMLLSEVIDQEIEDLTSLGDVFVFGDHGAREMDEVFKVNRWLMDKGYLSVDIDEDYIEKSIEYGQMEEPDGPGTIRQVGMPGVTINEDDSIAVCDDPFSGGITLLDGTEEEESIDLLRDLAECDHTDGVDIAADTWSGDLIGEAPDLYPRRPHGTFYSGNLAEELGGAEITRSGVHHPVGAWGSTADLDSSGEVDPQDLFGIILSEFLGIDPDVPTDQSYDRAPADGDSDAAKERLRDLGYL